MKSLGTALAVAKAGRKLAAALQRSKSPVRAAAVEEENPKMALSPHHRSMVRISVHRNSLAGPLGVLSAFLKLKLKVDARHRPWIGTLCLHVLFLLTALPPQL